MSNPDELRHPGSFCWLLMAASSLLFSDLRSVYGEELKVTGGVIDVQFKTSPTAALKCSAMKWIQQSSQAAATYYGIFPVKKCVLNIALNGGREPSGGETFGWDGALINISLGRATTDAGFAEDWILTHEMLHLGFPNVPDQHHWIEEGLAVYIEPIARARAGFLTPEQVWGDFARDAPQGQPEAGDKGLDYTHTWGRTYWGGALFAFRADVEMRRRTGNQRGLEHALRAILSEGGNIESSWKLDRVIAVGDKAVGQPVLRELYDQMKSTPVTVDLSSSWKQLGIVRKGDKVSFDDTAPLAAIRKRITER